MKSLKTYNLDHDVITILQPIKNKSRFVCRAVRRMKNGSDEFDIDEVSSRQLIIYLKNRSDISPQLAALLELELRS